MEQDMEERCRTENVIDGCFHIDFIRSEVLCTEMTLGHNPTIVDQTNFDAVAAAKAIFKAINGIGTDGTSIVQTISSCSVRQRQDIKKQFHCLYNKDIVKEFKSELRICLSFDFKQLLESLFMTREDFDASRLKKSVKGLGTDEKALVEILLTRSTEELKKAKTRYLEMFGVSLEADVADDTSGDFRKLVYSLSRAIRSNSLQIDRAKAAETAEEIDRTFTEYRGTDTPRFDFLGFCSSENHKQMQATFEAYEKLTERTIIEFIEKEFHGDTASALKGAVKCSKSIPGFLAERLWKALNKIPINDETLIRIIVSRSEVDLEEIKLEFQANYDKSLETKVKHHTSGQYKQLLLAIIKGNKNKN